MRTLDVMSRPVHVVRETDSIDRVAALLADHDISAAPVLDSDGAVIGMISRSDLLPHQRPGGPAGTAVTLTAGGVMSKPVPSVPPHADVAETAESMLRHGVHSLPVLDDTRLVGIVSRHDLLRVLAGSDGVRLREIQRRLDDYADGEHRWVVQVADRVAYVTGEFTDEVEHRIVSILARTVPGVVDVVTSTPRGERFMCG